MPFSPHRARRFWRAMGAFGRRDPTLFVFMYALWMLLMGMSLLAPGDAYQVSPVYALAAEMHLPENTVGALMLANALLLFWCLGQRPPAVRAWVAYMSGALWTFWALLMLFSGLQVHFVSGGAVWTIAGAIALIRAATPFADPHEPEVQAPPLPLPMSPRIWEERRA